MVKNGKSLGIKSTYGGFLMEKLKMTLLRFKNFIRGILVFGEAVPPYDVSNSNFVRTENFVKMGGRIYHHAITFRRGQGPYTPHYTLHNLNGKYTKINGYIGHIDRTGMTDVSFNFYVAGKLSDSYHLEATDLPIQISINVAGIRQLKIEVEDKNYFSRARYAFAGAILE